MMRKATVYLLAALAAVSACAPDALAAERRWDKETLDMFATLPVQDEGRVKPLDTYARFKLLKLNGRRSFRNADGQKGTPLEWLLDCLFYPEAAADYETFVVDNSEVIIALGLPEKERRDRYSYKELVPARDRLYELASKYGRKEGPRPLVENQLINLANNVHDFEQLAGYFDFARVKFDVSHEVFQDIFPGKTELRLQEFAAKAPALVAKFSELNKDKENHKEELEALASAIAKADAASSAGAAIRIVPPVDPASTEWATPADILGLMLDGTAQPAQADIVTRLEALAGTRDNPAAFLDSASQLNHSLAEMAAARGEYEKIPLEVTFYRGQYFYYALVMYIHAFLVISFLWLRAPKKREGFWRMANLALLALPTVLLITGIVMRSIIRGRPPVTTLYETILFCTAVAAVVSICIEFLNRQRIALALGSLLGVVGMFLANKYEVQECADTMPAMVAVLDTNFWLATHVTTIAVGYGAGLLASALAHVYVFWRLLQKTGPIGPVGRISPPESDERQRAIARTVYGVLCFSLLFSVLGTVLGGIWANESWGRFWGWDPKENGALMIVLWQLAILHAKRGGLIGDLGVNLAVIAGGLVIAFSWFGVNLLGVGLHSYGFTSGTFAALASFYVLESVVILLGALTWRQEKRQPALRASAKSR